MWLVQSGDCRPSIKVDIQEDIFRLCCSGVIFILLRRAAVRVEDYRVKSALLVSLVALSRISNATFFIHFLRNSPNWDDAFGPQRTLSGL